MVCSRQPASTNTGWGNSRALHNAPQKQFYLISSKDSAPKTHPCQSQIMGRSPPVDTNQSQPFTARISGQRHGCNLLRHDFSVSYNSFYVKKRLICQTLSNLRPQRRFHFVTLLNAGGGYSRLVFLAGGFFLTRRQT
jgi:hypothetical protein